MDDDREYYRRFQLREGDAEQLWNYLNKSGYIEKALESGEGRGSYKKILFEEYELAESLMAFFAAHERQTREMKKLRLEGKFFGYKKSFRDPRRVLRSLFTIDVVDDVYFRIHELQISSGLWEVDGRATRQESEGIGFVKTRKLWMILREIEADQPRIFCFPEFKTSTNEVDDKEVNVITTLIGHVMETGRKFVDKFFQSPTILIAADAEMEIIRRKYPDKMVTPEEYIDLVPRIFDEKMTKIAEIKQIDTKILEILGE